MKRVFFVETHEGIPSDGGETIRYLHIARHMKEQGYEIVVFASSYMHRNRKDRLANGEKYGKTEVDGINYIWLHARPKYKSNTSISRFLNWISFAISFLRYWHIGGKPDYIVATTMNIFSCAAGIWVARKNNAKFFAEIRDIWPESLIWFRVVGEKNPIVWVWDAFNRFLYSKAKKIVAVMPLAWRHLERYGIEKEKMVFIPNGIDMEWFEKNVNLSCDCWDDEILTLLKRFKCCVYVGGFNYYNDIMTLLKAAKLLQEKGNNEIRFILVGAGSDLKKMEEFVLNNNLQNVKIRLSVPQECLPWLLANSFLTILPTITSGNRFGGSQKKMNDYLAAGKPIILAGHFDENAVEEADSGIVIEGENPIALVDAIEYISKLPSEKLRKMGENSKKFALAKRDTRKLAEYYIKMFEE